MKIRRADIHTDYDKVWDIFKNVISTGNTYVFDPNTPKDSLHKHWFADYMDTFVAVDNDEILGTYIIKPNQIDLGDHVANCSYMVNPKHHGRGTGKLLCEHSINFAKDKGYLGIQFNIVVSTNEAAVKLWQKFGFDIIGTTPKGFRHKDLGLVDTYIMFKYLPTNEKTGYNVVLAIGGLNGFVSMEVQSSTSIHRMTVSAKNPAHHHVSVPL